MNTVRLTGGCQAGAVRYVLNEQPPGPHICHCRMCQKALHPDHDTAAWPPAG